MSGQFLLGGKKRIERKRREEVKGHLRYGTVIGNGFSVQYDKSSEMKTIQRW